MQRAGCCGRCERLRCSISACLLHPLSIRAVQLAQSDDTLSLWLQELEDKREVKRAQIAALQHSNAKRQAACNQLRERLVELDGLEKVLLF